jgi:nudix-type nucleoside diphosphatase (YffH/AdpP family)
LFDGFFKLDRTYLRHQMSDGRMSPEVMRLNIERGDGAAILLVNRDSDTVVLTRQFRFAPHLRGDGGLMIEIPAGTVPEGVSPAQVARSELLEEVGYRPGRIRKLVTFYSTPGTTTERTHLFYAEVDNRHKISAGGGLDSEHEYIEVIEMPVREALRRLKRGAFMDAKTIIALEWLDAQGQPARRRRKP